MKFVCVVVAASLAALSVIAPARAEVIADNAVSRSEVREVSEGGIVAAHMTPASPGPHPTIIVLGGSEGGTAMVRALGDQFVNEGYAVLALSYFGAPGLPATAENIPLEYFDQAISWLRRQPEADPERIGIFGISKGGEAALLVASRSRDLRAVAAGVPSAMAWQGIPNQFGAAPASTWSLDGAGVPYVPYDPTVRFDFARFMESVYALYAGALPSVEAHPEAMIPVERINGPVLLISGKEDAMWPSDVMSEMVMTRLRANDFAHRFDHLSYQDAGHAVSTPPGLVNTSGYPDEAAGGTAVGNAAGRADMWPRVIAFFDQALGRER